MNTVGCRGSQEFRTRGHYDGDFGGTCPIAGKTSAVSEEIGAREMDWMAHDFFRSILRFGPVLSKQQQAGHDAPDGRDNGEVTG